jgi:hypothetical protein
VSEDVDAHAVPPNLPVPHVPTDFPAALRQAISQRGLSLARLQAHLVQRGVQVGQSTLSYWQRGIRRPELPKALHAVRALESVLDLPPGSLVVLVANQASTERTHLMPASFADLRPGDSGPIADRLLTGLGAYPSSNRYNADLELLSVHDSVTFDAQCRQRSISTRLVTRSRTQGPDRYVTIYNGDEGCRIENAVLNTAEGCRVGRMRRDEGGNMLAVELLFDRVLPADAIQVFCFEVRDDSGGVSPGYFRLFRDQCASYLLQSRFHRRALPARCSRQFRTREDALPVESTDLPCDVGEVASAFFRDVGPGLAGLAVEWT